jgi:hypothetical protein
MKNSINYITAILLIFVFGCEEEGRIDFIDKSGEAPLPIENIEITPTPGGAVVHYDTPNLDKPEPNRKTCNFTEWNY